MIEVYLLFIIRSPFKGTDKNPYCMDFSDSFHTYEAAANFAKSLGSGYNCVIIKGTIV